MPTGVYDASYITFRKRAATLYGYSNNLKNASAANYNWVRREQPTFQSGKIITTRRQGGRQCSPDRPGVSFNRPSPGPCGC